MPRHKTDEIRFRVSPELKEKYQKVAAEESKSLSEWILEALRTRYIATPEGLKEMREQRRIEQKERDNRLALIESRATEMSKTPSIAAQLQTLSGQVEKLTKQVDKLAKRIEGLEEGA